MDEQQLSELKKKHPDPWVEIQRLTALVEDLQQQLEKALEGNKEQQEILKDLQEKLDVLITQSKKQRKRQYGKKTERHNPRPASSAPKPAPSEPSQPPSSEKLTGAKSILKNAESLPHEPKEHHVSPEDSICPNCNVETQFVSNLLTHQLEMVSAALKILEHSQETRSCPKCKQYIVTAEKPCPPIPGSYAGPRLLAEIIVGKLDDGLPNNRQQKIFARQNVAIPRSTQSGWMQATAETLSLLHKLNMEELFKSSVIKTDDSSIKVQDRKHKDNIRKAKMTAYVGNAETKPTIFDFSPDLSFQGNLAFLREFSGIVQADAAGGFDALFTDGNRTEAGCSAHSRRKYFESEFLEPDVCNTVLNIYRDLYRIEAEIKDKPNPVRLAIRRRKSKPLVKSLRKTIVKAKTTLNPSHDLMKAINYTLKHWIALTRFLKNPEIAIDNNECERAIKCWVLVRKNSLFAGSDQGAQSIAVHLSFIATCKRNGVNPVDWYADVLSRINSLKTTELRHLLPFYWSPP